MLGKAALRLVQANKLSVLPKRSYKQVLYQFSPPKNKLSNGELWVVGTLLIAGVLGPSFYMAANMNQYNGKAKAQAGN